MRPRSARSHLSRPLRGHDHRPRLARELLGLPAAVYGQWLEPGAAQERRQLRMRVRAERERDLLPRAVRTDDDERRRLASAHRVIGPLLEHERPAVQLVPRAWLKTRRTHHDGVDGVQHEARAGLERPGDRPSSTLVFRLLREIAERGEEVHGAVELAAPWKVEHVRSHVLDLDARLRGEPPRQLERRLRQVDARDAVAAPRELERVASVPAGDVEDPGARLDVEPLEDEVDLRARPLAFGIAGEGQLQPDVSEERLVPPRVGRRRQSGLAELLARELAEALTGELVRPERLVVGVARVGRDLLGHRPHLLTDARVVRRVAEQRLNPRLRPVVLREVVVDEQPPEQHADADVGERLEGEDAPRRRDKARDLGVLLLNAGDDRADRLVDQRDPDLFVVRHGRSIRRSRLSLGSWSSSPGSRQSPTGPRCSSTSTARSRRSSSVLRTRASRRRRGTSCAGSPTPMRSWRASAAAPAPWRGRSSASKASSTWASTGSSSTPRPRPGLRAFASSRIAPPGPTKGSRSRLRSITGRIPTPRPPKPHSASSPSARSRRASGRAGAGWCSRCCRRSSLPRGRPCAGCWSVTGFPVRSSRATTRPTSMRFARSTGWNSPSVWRSSP